jgi:hypothetical protein
MRYSLVQERPRTHCTLCGDSVRRRRPARAYTVAESAQRNVTNVRGDLNVLATPPARAEHLAGAGTSNISMVSVYKEVRCVRVPSLYPDNAAIEEHSRRLLPIGELLCDPNAQG